MSQAPQPVAENNMNVVVNARDPAGSLASTSSDSATDRYSPGNEEEYAHQLRRTRSKTKSRDSRRGVSLRVVTSGFEREAAQPLPRTQ